MQLILINCSVVLVTQDHVASVNHEFLVNQKVIPESFQKKSNSFNTPVVSQIYYSNGFNIIGEPNKTLFQFSNPNINESDNLNNLNTLKDICSKYVQLFNINYKAIGINFDFIRDDLGYQSFIEKVVNMDSAHLNFESNKGEIRSIDLSYNVRGKQFNVTARKVERVKQNTQLQETEKDFVPFFKVNVHYPSGYTDNTINIIGELEENYKKSKQFIEGF
ncbi:MAG: hypothetical protein OXH36_02845 [Bdellovibrionales bacterium]|nr:hypothetical protein [Bdellovibrionales bacterium]